jgi:hypothetical protein
MRVDLCAAWDYGACREMSTRTRTHAHAVRRLSARCTWATARTAPTETRYLTKRLPRPPPRTISDFLRRPSHIGGRGRPPLRSGRHLGLLRVPSILRPLPRPTPRDAAVAGGAHGRGLPARRWRVRLHLRRRRAEPSACRRYALMRSISSRRSVWFTLNSSSGVAARRNAAPSHECADEASPAFPCVCRRGG